jgi:hypothetical protein
MNSDTLNGLMEKRAHLDYPDADCSDCSGCDPADISVSSGTVLSDQTVNGVRTIQIETVTIPGNGVQVSFNIADNCKFDWSIQVDDGSWTGRTAGVGAGGICGPFEPIFGYYYPTGSVTAVYSCQADHSDFDYSEVYAVGIYNDTAMTVTVTISAIGDA